MNEYQQGRKDMLRTLILASNHHNDLNKFVIMMESMLKQTEELFPDTENYLQQ